VPMFCAINKQVLITMPASSICVPVDLEHAVRLEVEPVVVGVLGAPLDAVVRLAGLKNTVWDASSSRQFQVRAQQKELFRNGAGLPHPGVMA
jgi:hypothetical protein